MTPSDPVSKLYLNPMTESNENPIAATPADAEGMTHVITQGGFKNLESSRKRLASNGVKAAVICPPGVDTNA